MLFGNAAVDPVERMQRFVELILLEMNARQTKRRFVAHRFIDVALEHRLDCAARAMVHSIAELEIADGELRLADVESATCRAAAHPDRVMLAKLRIEPLERLEVLALMCVIQRLSEVEILELAAERRLAASNAVRPRPSALWSARAIAYQSPTSMALPALGPANVMPTSFGSTPLSIVKRSVCA